MPYGRMTQHGSVNQALARLADVDDGAAVHLERSRIGCGVFGVAQLVSGDAVVGERLPRREQLGWPQQTADVVGSIG